MMAYTSSLRFADTSHAHEIEVIGAGQTRQIVLPDRPDDYSQHKGDVWKLDIIEDLGFLPGTCLRYIIHIHCVVTGLLCRYRASRSIVKLVWPVTGRGFH